MKQLSYLSSRFCSLSFCVCPVLNSQHWAYSRVWKSVWDEQILPSKPLRLIWNLLFCLLKWTPIFQHSTLKKNKITRAFRECKASYTKLYTWTNLEFVPSFSRNEEFITNYFQHPVLSCPVTSAPSIIHCGKPKLMYLSTHTAFYLGFK